MLLRALRYSLRTLRYSDDPRVLVSQRSRRMAQRTQKSLYSREIISELYKSVRQWPFLLQCPGIATFVLFVFLGVLCAPFVAQRTPRNTKDTKNKWHSDVTIKPPSLSSLSSPLSLSYNLNCKVTYRFLLSAGKIPGPG